MYTKRSPRFWRQSAYDNGNPAEMRDFSCDGGSFEPRVFSRSRGFTLRRRQSAGLPACNPEGIGCIKCDPLRTKPTLRGRGSAGPSSPSSSWDFSKAPLGSERISAPSSEDMRISTVLMSLEPMAIELFSTRKPDRTGLQSLIASCGRSSRPRERPRSAALAAAQQASILLLRGCAEIGNWRL